MAFSLLNFLCCGCFSSGDDEGPGQHEVVDDETTRLMSSHEIQPMLEDEEPQDEETLQRQQLLGEIVRETEGKMVNMGIRFPFNLFPKNQQQSLSRSSSMYFDLRTKGYDFYDGIHRDVYQDPYLGPRLHSDGFYYDTNGYRDPRDYDPNVVTYGPDGYREEPTYINNTTYYGGRPPSPTFGEFENYTYRRYKPNPNSNAGALWKLRVIPDDEVVQESELREASEDDHHFARKSPEGEAKPLDAATEAINRLKNFDPEVAIFKW